MTGGDAAPSDELTADGQTGVSFIHPMGEIFLQPLAGEADTKILYLALDTSEFYKNRNQPQNSEKPELIIIKVARIVPQRICVPAQIRV